MQFTSHIWSEISRSLHGLCPVSPMLSPESTRLDAVVDMLLNVDKVRLRDMEQGVCGWLKHV